MGRQRASAVASSREVDLGLGRLEACMPAHVNRRPSPSFSPHIPPHLCGLTRMASARCCSFACSSALASTSRRPFSTAPFPTSAFHRPTAKAAKATSPVLVRSTPTGAEVLAGFTPTTSDGIARAGAAGNEASMAPPVSAASLGPKLIFDQPRHITYPQNQVHSTRMSLAHDQGSELRRTSLKGAFSHARFRVSVARKEFLPAKGAAQGMWATLLLSATQTLVN